MNKQAFSRVLSRVAIAIALCITAACGNKKQENNDEKEGVPVYRFEQLMFGTAPQALPDALKQQAHLYSNTLLNIYPDDAHYLAQVADMAQDAIMREIYDTVSVHFKDMSGLQKELSEAITKAEKLDDSIHCDKVVTFISGLLDYTNRVAANESSLLIALDQYVVPSFKKYGFFDLPTYLVELSTPQHIVPDAMAAIARNHIALPENTQDPMLLDYMIAEGKVLYFLDKVLPKTADTLKIRYSAEQWQWATKNEGKVWAYWLQHELLFERDNSKIFNFTDDAPKTNAFGDSAPRMTDFIGWHIVEQYMNKSNVSLHSLFMNTDARQILKESGWKPKRQ